MAAKKLLIAEDEIMVLEIYKDAFCGAGFEVELAENGLQALELVKSQSFDATLTDLMMPVMDGLLFIKSVYSDLDKSRLGKLFVLTNHDNVVLSPEYEVESVLLKANVMVTDLVEIIRTKV